MENVLDILPIGVFVLDARFQVAEVNKTLAEFFGVPQEQMLGQDKKRLVRERLSRIMENGYAFSARVLATYRDNTYIERFVCHVLPEGDREERWLQHNSRPILTGTYKGGRIESYTDITGLILAEQEIQWITTRSLQLQEKEKARIASNLHDELGQAVLAIRFSLENLQASLMKRADSPDSELRELQKSISWVEKLGTEVRDISSALMPPLLGPLGLDETLVWLAEQYSSIAGVDICYQSFGVQQKKVFRIARDSHLPGIPRKLEQHSQACQRPARGSEAGLQPSPDHRERH